MKNKKFSRTVVVFFFFFLPSHPLHTISPLTIHESLLIVNTLLPTATQAHKMNNLVGQAERVAHIVSEWLFGHADAPTHTTPSHDTHSTPSGASYAASLASSYWNTYFHGEKGDAFSSLSSFWNQHQWLNDPSAAFDSFLWNYTPDLHSLQHRYGLDENSMDMRIVALAVLLPLVLLLLIMVYSKGAGHTDENNHPGLQRNRAGSALVKSQKTAKGSSKVGGGSSKTKGSQAQKKSGGAQDNSRFTLLFYLFISACRWYILTSYRMLCSWTSRSDRGQHTWLLARPPRILWILWRRKTCLQTYRRHW